MSPADFAAADTVSLTAVDELQDWASAFEAALAAGDPDRVADLFSTDCYWRDLIAFTWTIRTFEGKEPVRQMVADRAASVQASLWRVTAATAVADGIDGWLDFETALARGRAHAAGNTVREIARKLGLGHPRVGRWVCRIDFPERNLMAPKPSNPAYFGSFWLEVGPKERRKWQPDRPYLFHSNQSLLRESRP